MYQKSFNPTKSGYKGSFNSSNKSRSGNKFATKSHSENNQFKNTSNGSYFYKPGKKNNRPSRFQRRAHTSIDNYSKYIKKASPASDVEKYTPKYKFADFNLVEQLKNNIETKGYIIPTPIQDQAIPIVLDKKDIIGVADTGTGKTAAFIVPLINKIFMDREQKVLIVAPTRELASQIDTELKDFARHMKIFSAQCIGGVNIRQQIFDLNRNPQFIIGTPGRLNDLIQRGRLKLNNVQNIVLDEVDRMVDMGFIDDIKKILSLLPKNRQSLFFSATVPPKISNLIKGFSNNPITISIKSSITSENIEQDIVKVKGGQEKIEVLHELLIKEEFKKVLIFGRTKRGVEDLSNKLFERGFKSTSIHGDKPQTKREKALRLFKQDYLNILVATDVAARGLDISDITHVINYDPPENHEDYIHRIGRTGRANKRGKALTFVS